VITVSGILIDELRAAGLCSGDQPQLTDKGREWLQQLETVANRQQVDQWTMDLMESINATNR
jgi:hypothetical protein